MIKRLFATIALSVVVASPVTAATINYFTGGTAADSPGLTGFVTTGADMDGMQVTACFTAGGCQTRAWTDRAAPGSGGVTGTGWDLSLTGDSFGGAWLFDLPTANLGQLVSLLLDGSTGFVLFDRTFGNAAGTDGSANGFDWDTTLNTGTVAAVTYLNPTGINGAAPVGDVFQQLFVNFGQTGPRTSFSFQQDTDNDLRATGKVPEPSTLLLLGIALLAWVGLRRR